MHKELNKTHLWHHPSSFQWIHGWTDGQIDRFTDRKLPSDCNNCCAINFNDTCSTTLSVFNNKFP